MLLLFPIPALGGVDTSKHGTKTRQLGPTLLTAQRCQNLNKIRHLVKKEKENLALGGVAAFPCHVLHDASPGGRRRGGGRRRDLKDKKKDWVEKGRKSFCFT